MTVECCFPFCVVFLFNAVSITGPQALDHMDFHGTTFVEDTDCAGFIGFIFGFHSAQKFYLMTWRHKYNNFDVYGGMKGLQIRVWNMIWNMEHDMHLDCVKALTFYNYRENTHSYRVEFMKTCVCPQGI